MGLNRVLLLYITPHSGHHQAALAIERALTARAPHLAIWNVDGLAYTNPVLARVISRTYLRLLKTRPDVWEHLYDNPEVFQRVRHLRALIHRYNSERFSALIETCSPDAIICTQAFPCGMVADYKASHGRNIPLIAVLTDYAAHAYWVHEQVDCYVVASAEARARLEAEGIAPERIRHLGIPIDSAFASCAAPAGRREASPAGSPSPRILLMGGGSGFGPIPELAHLLQRLPGPLELVVLTGTNTRLWRWFRRREGGWRHPMQVEAFTDGVAEHMRRAQLLVTKPGGLTTAEALAAGLPMVLVDPIPGQEAKNAEYLVTHHAAIRAAGTREAAWIVEELLRSPRRLEQLQRNAARIARPQAALEIADVLLNGSCR